MGFSVEIETTRNYPSDCDYYFEEIIEYRRTRPTGPCQPPKPPPPDNTPPPAQDAKASPKQPSPQPLPVPPPIIKPAAIVEGKASPKRDSPQPLPVPPPIVKPVMYEKTIEIYHRRYESDTPPPSPPRTPIPPLTPPQSPPRPNKYVVRTYHNTSAEPKKRERVVEPDSQKCADWWHYK